MQKALAANKARSGDVATLCEKEIAETKVWVDAGHVSFLFATKEVWGKEGPMGCGGRGMQVRVSAYRRIDASAVGDDGQTGDGATRVERRNARDAQLLVVAALSSSYLVCRGGGV